MTPGIALSTDKSTLFYIDSNGTKTDIDLLNGNAAKITKTGGNVFAEQVTSVPNGTTTQVPLNYYAQAGYDSAKSQAYIVGTSEMEFGLGIRVHPTDLTRQALYVKNDGNNLVLTQN